MAEKVLRGKLDDKPGNCRRDIKKDRRSIDKLKVLI